MLWVAKWQNAGLEVKFEFRSMQSGMKLTHEMLKLKGEKFGEIFAGDPCAVHALLGSFSVQFARTSLK